jgi:hypothetical protein
MNCPFCLEDLSGATATATLPCCAKLVHTACLVKDISLKIENDFGLVQCDCGVNIWETQYHDYEAAGSIDARVTTLLAQPDVRQEVKEIKKASTAMTKANRAFGAHMKGIKASYKEQTAQHIVALKQLRDATKSSIKQSAEYKAYRRARNVISNLQTKFRTKHNVSSREYRHILGYSGRSMPLWSYRYYTVERILRRILCIRI